MARSETTRIKVDVYQDGASRDADQDSESPRVVLANVTAIFEKIRLMGVAERNPDGRQVRAVETYRMSLTNSDRTRLTEDMWAIEKGSGRRWNFVSIARPPGRGGDLQIEVRELINS